MAKKKQAKKENKIVVVLYIILIFMVLTLIFGRPKEDPFEDIDWDEERAKHEYQQSTKRLINETGFPKDFTCEQIKIMIQTEIYPKHISSYECKNSPEEEYSWCETYTNPNTKESFVKYYLLNCLETKTDAQG